MKTPTKAIFASALVLSVVAPSLSYAAYYVDQTKTWALETRAQAAMDKVTRHKPAKTQVSKDRTFEFYGRATRRCPELVLTRDDSRNAEVQIIDATGSALARGRCHFFQSRNAFSLLSARAAPNARMSAIGT